MPDIPLYRLIDARAVVVNDPDYPPRFFHGPLYDVEVFDSDLPAPPVAYRSHEDRDGILVPVTWFKDALSGLTLYTYDDTTYAFHDDRTICGVVMRVWTGRDLMLDYREKWVRQFDTYALPDPEDGLLQRLVNIPAEFLTTYSMLVEDTYIAPDGRCVFCDFKKEKS